MKLRNKKTGEIIDNAYIRETDDFYKNRKRTIAVFVRVENRPPARVSIGYETLVELNEEWEDYKEPKEYWYIDTYTYEIDYLKEGADEDRDNFNKLIGNYFETKEEAEKAVEKLKAWKRLKDKGFKFKGWEYDDRYATELPCILIRAKKIFDCDKDLDLLFGGEDE